MAQMTQPTLILCGSVALDRIMNFSGSYKDLIKPDKLHVLSVSVLLEKMEETRGGIAANIAYNSAMLGEHPILLASIGQDGTEYLDDLTGLGIDTSHVHVSELPTSSFNVMTDSDDNQVGGFYPGAMSDAASLTLKPWADAEAVVCVSAHDPDAMRNRVKECQQYGFTMMYDPGQQVTNTEAADLEAGVEAAEILIANDYELGVLCDKIGRSPEDIKAQTPLVITTLGKEGSVIEGTKTPDPIRIPIVKAPGFTEPTGAGDAYRAGFLYGYLRKWQLPVCGRLGATVASFAVEHHGTQAPLTKEAVRKRYQETFNEEIQL
jgi:adenosine kinase